MSLGTTVLKVGTFQKHLLKREQKKKARKRILMVGLNLTAMVDMFSLLVIFLLQSFSASPELVMATKGVVLPTAISAKEIKDAPLLSLSTEGVFLDQKLVGKTEDLLKDPTPLMSKLGELRDLWQESHPNETFKGEINLQAHRELPSTMVSQFMGMLPSQHYGSIQLAVVSARGN